MPDGSFAVHAFTIIYSTFGTILFFIIGYSIFHMLAKIFGGIATGSQYFRVLSNVMWIKLILAIPILSFLMYFVLAPYLIVLNIFVLKRVHALSWTKAIIIGLSIPALGILLFIGIFGVLLFSRFG